MVAGPDPDGHLPLTLAALAGQTYPASLTEVVVETDGGEEEAGLREAVGDLTLEVSPRARGSGAASGEVVLFLPAGSLPERELIEAHARWHHAVADAVSVGTTRRIDAAGLDPAGVGEAQSRGELEALVASRLGGDDGEEEEALEAFLERTHGLTERRPDLFRIAARASVALRADMLRAAEEPAEGRGRGPAAGDRRRRITRWHGSISPTVSAAPAACSCPSARPEATAPTPSPGSGLRAPRRPPVKGRRRARTTRARRA